MTPAPLPRGSFFERWQRMDRCAIVLMGRLAQDIRQHPRYVELIVLVAAAACALGRWTAP